MNGNHVHEWDYWGTEDITTGPRWEDECCHGMECYIGSVKITGDAVVDVYVFKHGPEDSGQQVCIRFGNELGDYISPGTLLDLLIAARMPGEYRQEYKAAAFLIDQRMEIRGKKVV